MQLLWLPQRRLFETFKSLTCVHLIKGQTRCKDHLNMFRLLPKLPVESYLAFKQIVNRNVRHTVNTNGIFPNITKKTLIQSWKPKFTHLIKPPIEYIKNEETTPSGSIWKRLEGVGKDLSSILIPTRETIDKCAGKLITGKNKKNQFAVQTAGKIRKHIGDFQRAYFRTDVVALCDCKDGNKNADPKSFRKQRKSPKKKLGGQCPYIKEECLRKSGDQSKKTKGSKQRGEKCSKAVPCGKKGAKKDAKEQKKSETCCKAETKTKETSRSQKKQDDTCNKNNSSTQGTCSAKVDSCKKTKPTTKAAGKGEKTICSSKDDSCKKIKSSKKGCGKGEKPICSSPNTTSKKKSSDSFCASKRSNDCFVKDKKGASCASKESSDCSTKAGKDASCASLLKKKEKKPQKKKSCQAMGARCSKQKGSCGAVKKKLICSKRKRAIASEMKTCKPKRKDKECRTAEKKSSKCPAVNTCALKKCSSSKYGDKKCTKETSCPAKEDTEKLTQCKQASSSFCASTKRSPSNENQKKCTQPRKSSSDPCAGKKSTEKGCPSKDKPTQCRKASSDSAAGKKLPPKRCPSKDNDGKCKLAFTTKETAKEADVCSAKAGPAKQTRSCCKVDRLRSSCKSKAAHQFDFTVPNLCQGLPPKERKKCEVQRDRWMMLKEAWLKQWSKKRC